MVDGDGDPRPCGESGQPRQLGLADDLVGDQDILKTVFDQHLGLAHLGARHADGAGGQLPFGERNAFVVLEMGTQFHRAIAKEGRHFCQIAIARPAVQQQRRRVQLAQRPSDPGIRARDAVCSRHEGFSVR